jgi:hypothetical protein
LDELMSDLPQVAAHNIRVAVHCLAVEIGRRVHEAEFRRAERDGTLSQIPPGHDFGESIVTKHAEAVLLDYLLGDFKPVKG